VRRRILDVIYGEGGSGTMKKLIDIDEAHSLCALNKVTKYKFVFINHACQDSNSRPLALIPY
jgi:hypothetical protein